MEEADKVARRQLEDYTARQSEYAMDVDSSI